MTGLNQKENPFPGLRPFMSDESHLFFGRDGQSDELLKRLGQNRFLAVVGRSGSGKSSLVRAGLLPTVHGGFIADAGSHWRVAVFRPGDNPIKNFAKALSQPGVLKGKPLSKEDHNIFAQTIDAEIALRRGSLGLVDIFRQSRLPEEENLLVVVDQFEEVFRFKESGWRDHASDEAAAFVKLLLNTVEQKEVPIYIVITMRSEFLGDCAQFRDLPEAINNSQYLIPRMTRDEKREAIEGPVAVGGAEISPALVSRLLNDVGDNPDQLPILQHALMRTWDYWAANHTEGEPLDLRHYEAIGTMERALSRHAEEAYAELKTKKNLLICEKMFKLLTDRGEMGHGVRRPAKLSEICSVTNSSEGEVIDVINVFRQAGRTFLMPPREEKLKADSMIDISHESLMRIWTRLIRWVKEESNSAELYLRLAQAAALHKEGKTALWGDPDLMLALKWREESKPNAVWAQRYNPEFDRAINFLEASKQQKDLKIKAKEREQKAKIKRTRIFAAAISITAVIALVFAVLALKAKRTAINQKNIAEKALIQAENAKKDALYAKVKAEDERNRAEEAQKALKKKTKETIKAWKEKEETEKKALKDKLAKIEAEKNELKKTIQKLIGDMKGAEATFREYLGKAKELAVHSMTETKRKDLKALLALTAFRLNNKAYENFNNRTETNFKEFQKLKIDNSMDDVTEAGELEDLHKDLQENPKMKRQPAEIFEALRKAYIANQNPNDIFYPAESRALAAVGNNNIVFNNWEGELFLSSLQLKSNDLIPVLKRENINLSGEGHTVLWASSFVETNDHLFCGTREGSIIYWEKNKWEEGKTLGRHIPPIISPILAMAYAKNKKWLIYSVENVIIYRYNLIDEENAFPVEEENFIRAVTLVENHESSFLIYADSKADSNKKANIYCLHLSNDRNEKKKLIGSLDSEGVYAIAYNYPKKLLALGSEKGKIYIKKIDCKSLESDTEIKFSPMSREQKGIVKALAFSPDGRYLASGSLDSTIMLWDLEGKDETRILQQEPVLTIGSERKILSILFDARGDYLIFNDEQYLQVCPTSPEIFYKELCKRKKRDLTKVEWNQYIGKTIKKEDIIICSSEEEI